MLSIPFCCFFFAPTKIPGDAIVVWLYMRCSDFQAMQFNAFNERRREGSGYALLHLEASLVWPNERGNVGEAESPPRRENVGREPDCHGHHFADLPNVTIDMFHLLGYLVDHPILPGPWEQRCSAVA